MAAGGSVDQIDKKNISGLVTCPLCLEYYQKPKLLPCGHSVCKNCLKIYLDKTVDQGTFLCPICRNPTTLPEDGLEGFTHSFFIVKLQDEYNKVPVNRTCDPCGDDATEVKAIAKCVECCEYICGECLRGHRKARLSKKHCIISLNGEGLGEGSERIRHITRIKCHNHQDEVVRYFCVPCQKLICRDCKALDHAEHKAVPFHEAVHGKRDDMRHEIEDLNKKCEELSKVADEMSQTALTLQNERKALVGLIERERDELLRLITASSENAIKRVDTIMSVEIKKQETEFNKAQFLLTEIKCHIPYAKVLLANGSDVDVLSGSTAISERSAHLAAESVCVPDHQIPKLHPTIDSHMVKNHFRLTRTCRIECPMVIQTLKFTAGGVISAIALHHSNVFVCAGGDLHTFHDGTLTNISENYGTEGTAYSICVDNNTIVLSKESTRRRVQLVICEVDTGTYTTLKLPFKSNHPAVVCGLSRKGQPTYIVVGWDTVHRIDHEGSILQTYGKGELKSPRRVALDVAGNVVVVDTGLRDVIVFNSDGGIRRCLGQQDSLSAGQLSYPVDVCVDQDGYIFVSSFNTNSVLMFSSSGDYMQTLLTKEDGIECPKYIAVSQLGHLAVTVTRRWILPVKEIKLYKYKD